MRINLSTGILATLMILGFIITGYTIKLEKEARISNQLDLIWIEMELEELKKKQVRAGEVVQTEIDVCLENVKKKFAESKVVPSEVTIDFYMKEKQFCLDRSQH